MIRVNLLPIRQVRALRRRRRAVTAGAAALLLAAGALAAGNLSQWSRVNAVASDLVALRQRVAALRVEAAPVKALEETVGQARRTSRAVTAWLERPAEHPRVLRGLSAAAPDRLWLTRYTDSGQAAVLEGQATDDESIARFLRDLSGTFQARELMEAGRATGEAAERRGLRRFVVHARNGLPPDSAPPRE